MGKTTVKLEESVKSYLDSLDDDQLARDSLVLIKMLKRISGQPPKLWNVGTIGFGTYHYRYDSGREGDGHTIGFYPRKGKITIYLMDGTRRHAKLLARLGKHTTSRVCVYINRLSDVDVPTLEQILQQSYKNVEAEGGKMHGPVQ